MDKDSFIFYRSFYEAIKDIPPEEQAAVFRAICEYALNGKKPKIKGTASGMFKLIVPQIDANNARYENGKKGGRPNKIKGSGENLDKTKPKPNHNLDITKPKPNVNVNVNENVNDNENVNVNVNASGSDETTNTRPPTVREVIQEAKELGHHMTEIEAQKFIDYNESLGWKMKPSYALPKWFENRSYKNRSPAGKFANFPINHENDELRKMIIAQELGGGT